MYFNILTLFPEMFNGPLNESMIGRAQENDLLDINIINIRDYASGKHQVTDDAPYGGGAGMVMKVEPVYKAWEDKCRNEKDSSPVILMSPQGRKLNQEIVKDLSAQEGLTVICGHYEGFDDRIRSSIVTDEISIGDYVLTGGELAAMVLIDAVARMIPGVLGDENSVINDSFYNGLLDYPHYTRPRSFKGMEVPEVLLSGNHAEIDKWRQQESLKRTLLRRPDLLEMKTLTDEEIELLEDIKKDLKVKKR
ncbi:tRNA (guanosine(37)-N1)-methyltransferase TrmD [Halocella sp. SP3-1]|uniref:tRNA (guanosine(37)-N1)-methyltransferase TrmD n=1 Tax=Halocella sp. SP3-1 TaxID=2382161 RepID=UPI000F750695|nr:tRNA (guanosine(37)-N1)-methyltransferase TrmD [Halocella sp. SP3-1]AZO95590.1 tRNA (guanosine(37)-N1)-methyltransferase TrmD [Halocella sp. SP3-1]